MKASEHSDNQPRISAAIWWLAAALVMTVLMVIVVRVRLLQIPLERDEGEYAYAGQLLLEGIPPYKLAYNIKLPGTDACYAAIMAVFGQTSAGIHFGFLLVNLGTLALFFFVARRLLDLPRALVACVCYALLSICPEVLGLQGHATQLVVLAALGGFMLLLKAREAWWPSAFGWSGAAFGLSFLCKQTGLFFGLAGLVVLLRDLATASPPSRSGRLKSIGFFCAGLTLPFLLTCLLLAWAGTFDRFWFWTMVYAPVHVALPTAKDARENLGDFINGAHALRWPCAAAAVGLICLLSERARNEARFVIGCLLVFSLIAFTAGFCFYPHYFIVMLPAVSLLIAIAVHRAARAMGWAIAAGGLALACAHFIDVHHALWFQLSPEAACRVLYGNNPFPEAVQIAKYIQEHSTAGDTMAVMGSEPEIFFYARRHSASPYIYMYDLTQSQRFAPVMQREMMQDISAAKPLFLVLVNLDSSWSFSGDLDRTVMNWGEAYSEKYYELAGMIWILPDRTEYRWGLEASKQKFNAPSSVAIWKRKPGV